MSQCARHHPDEPPVHEAIPARYFLTRYCIWRRQHADSGATTLWFKTAHTLMARNDEHARKKLVAMFRGAGFTNMQLVAAPEYQNPNFAETCATK